MLPRRSSTAQSLSRPTGWRRDQPGPFPKLPARREPCNSRTPLIHSGKRFRVDPCPQYAAESARIGDARSRGDVAQKSSIASFSRRLKAEQLRTLPDDDQSKATYDELARA